MVRAFLAYELFVIGVPSYIGVILGAVLMPLAWPFSLPARLYVIHFLELPNAVISILLARAPFYFLHVPAHWAILIISIVWITFYFFYTSSLRSRGWALPQDSSLDGSSRPYERQPSNQSVELTATRRAFTFYMTKTFSLRATLALGGGSSLLSR